MSAYGAKADLATLSQMVSHLNVIDPRHMDREWYLETPPIPYTIVGCSDGEGESILSRTVPNSEAGHRELIAWLSGALAILSREDDGESGEDEPGESPVLAGELLPCPFCGTTPEFEIASNTRDWAKPWWIVWCYACEVQPRVQEQGREATLRQWNQRAVIRPSGLGKVAADDERDDGRHHA